MRMSGREERAMDGEVSSVCSELFRAEEIQSSESVEVYHMFE